MENRDDEITRLQRMLAKFEAGESEQRIDLLFAIAAASNRAGDRAMTNVHLNLAAKVIRESGKRLDRLHTA